MKTTKKTAPKLDEFKQKSLYTDNYKYLGMDSFTSTGKVNHKAMLDKIIEKKVKTIGVYRLVMKSKSDNFRESAIIDVIKILKQEGQKIIIYEPLLDQQKSIMTFDIEKSFKKFTDNSDLIIANRIDTKIKPFEKKIFSRSISDEN